MGCLLHLDVAVHFKTSLPNGFRCYSCALTEEYTPPGVAFKPLHSFLHRAFLHRDTLLIISRGSKMAKDIPFIALGALQLFQSN